MSEEIDKLYKEYLDEKLDAIFNSQKVDITAKNELSMYLNDSGEDGAYYFVYNKLNGKKVYAVKYHEGYARVEKKLIVVEKFIISLIKKDIIYLNIG